MVARIRTIKPEFPQSQSMGRVSRDARLLFVLLWTIADDCGRSRASSRMLASLLFPYDEDAPTLILGWLEELERENCIARYTVDGNDYLEVCKWAEHQRIDRPGKALYPFREDSRAIANARENSPRTKDQGPRTKEVPALDARDPPPSRKSETPDRPDDVPEQVWIDWLAHRKRKRATVSATALDGVRSEAAKAGMTFAAALQHAIAQGWQGFRAEWVKRDGASAIPPRLVATSTQHIPNMPLGHANCSCDGCVSFRAKRAQ